MQNGLEIDVSPSVQDDDDILNRAKPDDFLTKGKMQQRIYAMTDNVSDEQFDDALSESRDENNLSRASGKSETGFYWDLSSGVLLESE